ncbi:MAG: hypothetical protein KA801_10105 [Syntrophorhabdaceae bacterium]|nr:hypothetical protein [Syntrophorhabdaceae bacterium]
MTHMRIIGWLKSKVYPVMCRYSSHATLVEGKLKNTGDTFRCLFVENTDLMSYILPRVYREPPVVLRTWRLWVPFIHRVLKNYSNSIDMCVAVLPLKYEPEFRKLAHFKSQTLVCSFIDTSCGWEDVRKRFQHDKRQFSNKMDRKPIFTCRISKDPKDFDFFYNEMYVPHIQKRFEDLADLDSYDQMRGSFLKGFLLVVEEGKKSVAGVLCEIENDTLLARRTGVLSGNEECIKRGASSAEYYFALKFALEHGLSRVDLLRSRPFFNDGVYSTKRKWGAAVYPDRQSESWVFFFIPKYSEQTANFFAINPVIIYVDDKMYGLVGWNNENPPSAKDEKELRKKYYSPGLVGLMLVQPHSERPILIPFT